jgi:hypothetical protein
MAVNVVTRLWVGQVGFNSKEGEIFPFTTVSRPVLGLTQPGIQWVLRGLFLRGKVCMV